jgi:hypothetical protein
VRLACVGPQEKGVEEVTLKIGFLRNFSSIFHQQPPRADHAAPLEVEIPRIVAPFGSDGMMNSPDAISLGDGIFLTLARASYRRMGQRPGIGAFRREVLVLAGKSLSALPSINTPFGHG